MTGMVRKEGRTSDSLVKISLAFHLSRERGLASGRISKFPAARLTAGFRGGGMVT